MTSKYITNDIDDKVKSTDLFVKFQNTTHNKAINNKRFKDDMLAISGISFKRNNGSYFIGIKAKEIIIEENE